jgi:predicted nucleotidyltransferase
MSTGKVNLIKSIERQESTIIEVVHKLPTHLQKNVCILATGSWGIKTASEDSDLDLLILVENESTKDELYKILSKTDVLKGINFDDDIMNPFNIKSYLTQDEIEHYLKGKMKSFIYPLIVLITKSRPLFGNEELLTKAKDQIINYKVVSPQDLLIYATSRYFNYCLKLFVHRSLYEYRRSVIKALTDSMYLSHFLIYNRKEIMRDWLFHREKHQLCYNRASKIKKFSPLSVVLSLFQAVNK